MEKPRCSECEFAKGRYCSNPLKDEGKEVGG